MSISVITRSEGRAGGLSRGTIDGRLRSKQYEALHRGIYLVGRPGSPRDDWLARMAGHIARGGPGSAVSYRAAALLGGLEGIEGYPEDLLVPHGSSFRAPPAIRTRSLLPEEIHVREGLATTKPERTLSDLAAVLPINSFEVAFESALRSEDPRRPLDWDVELWHRIVEILATLPRGRRRVVPGLPGPSRTGLSDGKLRRDRGLAGVQAGRAGPPVPSPPPPPLAPPATDSELGHPDRNGAA